MNQYRIHSLTLGQPISITSIGCRSCRLGTHNVGYQPLALHLRHQFQRMGPLATACTGTDAGSPGNEICFQHLLWCKTQQFPSHSSFASVPCRTAEFWLRRSPCFKELRVLRPASTCFQEVNKMNKLIGSTAVWCPSHLKEAHFACAGSGPT